MNNNTKLKLNKKKEERAKEVPVGHTEAPSLEIHMYETDPKKQSTNFETSTIM